MDKDVLVAEAQSLIRWLDETRAKPRVAMWVYSSETDSWRLWIVPAEKIEKSDFFLILSDVISKHRAEIPGFDIGMIDFKRADHPAVKGLEKFVRMDGIGNVRMSQNYFNGFLLPEGIVLRAAV